MSLSAHLLAWDITPLAYMHWLNGRRIVGRGRYTRRKRKSITSRRGSSLRNLFLSLQFAYDFLEEPGWIVY